MSLAHSPRSACPIAIALDVLGDRWSLLIVRDLMFGGPRGFRELAEADEAIATNILADRLERLTRAGIVARRRHGDDRRRVRYGLTAKGMDLAPVLCEIVLWSARHHRTGAPAPTLRRMVTHRREFLAELRARSSEPER